MQTSPPITHNNIPKFQQKANIFHNYFADHCNILDNGSILPQPISKTFASISHINVTTEQIVGIITKYTTNKAHGCDDPSVAMLQLCPS